MGNEERQRVFHVQETVLRYTSKALSANLDHEHLGDDERGILRFPEDPVDAWEVLVFWIVTKKIPESQMHDTLVPDKAAAQFALVQCWILGDKYGIVEFEDLIMIELLDLSSKNFITVAAAYEALTNTLFDSSLYVLVTCLIVASVFVDGKHSMEEFECLEGLEGYTFNMMETLHTLHKRPWRELNYIMDTRMGRNSGEW